MTAVLRGGIGALLVFCLMVPGTAEAQRRGRRRAAPDTAQLAIDGTEGAQVFVNGEPLGVLPTEGPLTIPAGQIELRVELEGYVGFERTFTAARNETVVEHATLLPEDEVRSTDEMPSFGVTDSSAPVIRRPSRVGDGGGGPPVGAIVLFVGGLVVAGGGGAMLGVGLLDKDAVENAGVRASWADVSEAYDRAPTLILAGDIVLGVGLLAALVGAVWWAVAPSEGGTAFLEDGALGVRF